MERVNSLVSRILSFVSLSRIAWRVLRRAREEPGEALPLTSIMVAFFCLCLSRPSFLPSIPPETGRTRRQKRFCFVCKARFCITRYFTSATHFCVFWMRRQASPSSFYALRHVLFICLFVCFFQLLIGVCALYFLLCRSYKSIGPGAEKVAWFVWFAVCGPK